MPGDNNDLLIKAAGNRPATIRAQAENPGGVGNIARPMPKIDEKAKAEKAATDFEALLLQQMLDSMWKNVPSGGLISGSKDEQTYRQMYNEALAKNVAEHQSIGVKDAIMRDFKELHKKYNPSGS